MIILIITIIAITKNNDNTHYENDNSHYENDNNDNNND